MTGSPLDARFMFVHGKSKKSCDKRRKIGEHAVSRSKKRFIAREIMTAITRHNKVQTARSAN